MAAHVSSPSFGLREFSALMRVRRRYAWEKLKGSPSQSRRVKATRSLVILGPIVLICSFLFVAIEQTFASANSTADAEAVLGALLALAALGSFVGSTTTVLQSLYLSNDLPFLMSLPLPLRVIYSGKLTDAMAGALPAGVVMTIALAAFGFERGGRAFYVLIALACLALTVLIATSVSVVLVAAVTRYVPPKKARIILIGGSFAIAFLVWTAWKALSSSSLPSSDGMATQQVGPVGEVVGITPAGWAARALSAAASGDISHSLTLGVAFAAFAGWCTLLSYRIFAGSFAIGYAKVRGLTGARPKRPFATAAANVAAWLPQDVGALVVKEWLVMFRDMRRLSGAFWPVGMVAVYTIALLRSNQRDGGEGLNFWLANAPLALLPWGLSLGISIYSIGAEGRNFELLRTMPMFARRLFLAKALASLAPVLIGTEMATLIVTLIGRASFDQVLGMTGIVAWASVGYVLIDTAASAIEPNFDADLVQRSTALGGRFYGFFTGAIFGVCSMIALGRVVLYSVKPPAVLEGAIEFRTGLIAPFGWPLVAIATACAIAVIALSVSTAIANLERLIEEGN